MAVSDPGRLAWAHVLEGLAGPTSVGPRLTVCAQAASTRKERTAASRRPLGGTYGSKLGKVVHAPSSSQITVLERPSETTATLYWRDPTRCRYGEQRWRRGVATRRGYCALSGMSIKRGDIIFRPVRSRPAPCNADEMILASALAQSGTTS
jgi:hypothetical protein